MIKINDVFYGNNTSDLLLRKSWAPSSGLYPTDITEGIAYIADDSGVVSGVSYSTNDIIVYKDGGWVSSSSGMTMGDWILLSASTTLTLNTKYLLDFGAIPAAFDITLPSSPNAGDEIILLHVRGDIESLNPTFPKILRAVSGEYIQELNADVDIDTNYLEIKLVYSGFPVSGAGDIGWRIL